MSFLDKEVKVIEVVLVAVFVAATIIFLYLWGLCLKTVVAIVAVTVITLFVSVLIAGILFVLRGGK